MAKAAFLSDEWFDMVKTIQDEMGDMEIPAQMQDLVLNVTVTTESGEVDICLNCGRLEKGHSDSAPTKMILPLDLALRLFVENDKSAGMQGFMSGQLKVEGDMSKLMAMQSVEPSAQQEELQQKILSATEM